MNIPEGWPTEEMQLAGAQAIRIDTTPINKIWTANKVFKAMLAAAPTPPAREDAPVAWKEAVRLAYGYLWHVNELREAPIPLYPPKRAAYEARKHLRELLTQDERGRGINDTREQVYGSREVPALHNDGLRQAAEEVVNRYYLGPSSGIESDLNVLISNLRAELNKK